MDDGNEFDIYEDLDVFESNEKQQEKNADYLELREKLTEAQEQIRQLQEENVSLKEQIVNHEKTEGTLERNSSSLLITAKAELKRREQEIHELRKEKDNLLFRRKDKLRKNVHSIGTQTQITCKPFMVYELKRTDDAAKERSSERRDENQSSNPFAKSKENNIDNKSNHKSREFFAEKNGNHRHQASPPPHTRHHDEYDLRTKLANPRSRDDERRDQSNAERSKRRRSRSTSKDRKRARRSRSREQQRGRRDRNHHEQNSPEKMSRNQRGKNDIKESQSPKRSTRCQSPKRTIVKCEPVEKHHSKRKPDEDISKRRSKSKSETEQLFTEKEIKREKEREKEKEKEIKKEVKKEKEKAIVNQCAVPSDCSKDDIKQENNIDEAPPNLYWSDKNGDHGLEEGEIDEDDGQDDDGKADNDALNRHNEEMDQNMAKSQFLPTSSNVDCKNECADDAKLNIKANAPMELQQNDGLPEKRDNISEEDPLPARDERKSVNEPKVEDKLEAKHEPALKPTPEIEKHTNSIDNVESESNSVQSLDGIDHKSQHQNIETEDKNSGENAVAMEGIETVSNIPTARDQLLDKSENMEIDSPAETEKTDEIVNPIMEPTQVEDQKQEIDAEKNVEKSDESSAIVVDVAEVPSLSETTPSLNNSISATTENKQTSAAATVANGSPEAIYNGVLNTSGSKSVKNISTSTKDYLIVENENNETTIYITRKKKQKKKKKSLENV